jgi:hypothetical protein
VSPRLTAGALFARQDTEKDLDRIIRELARLRGWWVEDEELGMFSMVYHTHRSERSQPGFPDLVMVRAPRVLFVELKSDRKAAKLSRPQQIWLDQLGQCPGVECYLWRPADLDRIQEILM